jgi:hypothetical protein
MEDVFKSRSSRRRVSGVDPDVRIRGIDKEKTSKKEHRRNMFYQNNNILFRVGSLRDRWYQTATSSTSSNSF